MPPTAPTTDERDPIVGSSMSFALLVSSVLMLGSLGWALYDEFYGLRPWKAYQRRFAEAYDAYLEKAIPEQEARERELQSSPSYQKLQSEWRQTEEAIRPELDRIRQQVTDLDRRISALTDVFATARGKVTALTYELETTTDDDRKAKLRAEIVEAKKGPYRARLPVPDGSTETVDYTYEQLEREYDRLKDEKGELLASVPAIRKQANELRAQLDAYTKEHLEGLRKDQLEGIRTKVRSLAPGIRQIDVSDTQLVDRCESCHLGVREPLVLTAADMGGEKVFASHPEPALLDIHDPERFGCSPCHGGNGRAISSPKKAHGRYKHWLWPLYARENVEAGCQQCHAMDVVLEHAQVLNEGKTLYREKGCIGCHRFAGYDDEAERLLATRQQITRLHAEFAEHEVEVGRSIRAGDRAQANEQAQRYYARADELRLLNSDVEARIEQLEDLSASLQREVKKVGPNLKEVRGKLRPEWIPVWIANPHEFRPTTRMPRFRLDDGEVKAIAAFIWQAGLADPIPSHPRGDPTVGRELFETRGCMGCHAIGEGDQAVGGEFAANLSRLGEKANYDYIVRWIHNPRERTRPYCPLEKRDLGPEDYAKHGVPFVFDLEHSACPNDGARLVVQQMTVMPNFRLTWEEAQDIASYLLTQKHADAAYPQAPFLEDRSLGEQGQRLVKHYGCAGCHEIAGLEEEGRIGTELTAEGSKPIERLDFGHLTHEAQREGWYEHKGFFERKLAEPEVFDRGRVHEDPLQRLRMPKPNLDEAEVRALTTFLLGSVEAPFPEPYLYRPTGERKDVQDGWWLVTKYNCTGCHVLRAGQKSSLMTIPRYQDPDWKDQLPPSLIGEGARVNPDWLAHFLENPAMDAADPNKNGVRAYLKARMPTFSFAPNEIRKLVRFFAALSDQAQPYLPPKLDPLTAQERQMARQLFTHEAAPCLKCHATGEPVHDAKATAPNFLLARERLKPGWTRRWILDPARIAPGTAMPSGLFRREGARWVFSGPHPPILEAYEGDHAALLVRYMFEFTPEEQRQLLARAGAARARVVGRSESGMAANLVESPASRHR